MSGGDAGTVAAEAAIAMADERRGRSLVVPVGDGGFLDGGRGRLGGPFANGIHAGGGRFVFTVKQTAERLGVSASLVYGLCSAGRLRHERYGLGRGTIRVPPDALDEYRRAQTVPAASRVATTPAPKTKPVQFKHLTIP